jgi:hypothetical protein
MSAASESVEEAAAAVVEATGVRGRHEVDSRVGHQVGLEFGDVDVDRAVEAERSCERGDAPGDEAVEVVVWPSLPITH